MISYHTIEGDEAAGSVDARRVSEQTASVAPQGSALKLYKVTGKKEYIELARFFLDERGHYNGREQYIFRGKNPTYFQDHLPVLEQVETTGHAVRACYMYAGMVDVGAMSGRVEYIEASNRLWENATGKKIYITGGVGASHTKGGTFDEAYMLPNLKAYAETCGAVGNILWNFRLAKYYKDAKYFDVLERTLYNAYLPSHSLHGVGYFYTNGYRFKSLKD